MVPVALVALFGYAVMTGTTGVRVLLLARRTRQLPEIALGFSYLVGGLFGWALTLVGGYLVTLRPEHAVLGRRMQFVGLFFLSSGTLSAALFSWRVFSSKSALMAALFFFLTAVLIADYVHNVLIAGVVFPPTSMFWYWPGAMGRLACFAWMSAAALHYYDKLRRRLPLGLADPIVVNRVLLWGLAGSITLVNAIVVCTASIIDIWGPYGPLLFLVTSITSALGALFGWLAFVPPRRYLRWIEARAPKVLE
jgi:hypothetical protein